jgi:ubiquinone/menaquinone biosynthesis C-methylase UbiE
MPGRIYEATWGRIFAAGYDWFQRRSEQAGMRERRRELLANAGGRTIELGAGTGVNIEHYPPDVGELVLTEPDRHMARRLRSKLGSSSQQAEVIEAGAERLPFEDASFDTAVFTLVLCTVPDSNAALAEVARILRPAGRLLFLEHVRSDSPRVARWQDRLHGPWKLFGNGCNCNRDTMSAIEAASFDVERVEHGEIPKAPPIVRPLIIGSARAAAG